MTDPTRPALADPDLTPDEKGVLVTMIDHHLGNLVICLPVLEALCAHFNQPPDLIVDQRHAPLASLLPSARRIIGYPSQSPRRRGVVRNLAPMWLMGRTLTRRYRIVIDVAGGARSATLTASTLARRRIGFANSRRSGIYNRRIERPPEAHAFDGYASILTCIGQPRRPAPLRLNAPPDVRAAVNSLLDDVQPQPEAPLLIIHPGAGHDWRRWPEQRFAEVADALVQRHGMNVCVIGSPGERSVMEAVIACMHNREAAFCLSLSLVQLLALFERASLIVSNESGPTHLAAATDLPIATIFGPSREQLWRPIRETWTQVLRGAECAPGCGRRRCVADRRCLVELTSEQVTAAAEQLLEAPDAHTGVAK